MKWMSKPIGAFCRTGSGGTPSRQQESRFYGGGIPWVKSGELRESIILKTEETITEAALAESSAKLIPSGALLVAMYGATVGRIAFLGIEATSNQAVCHIVPDKAVANQRYLFYALRQQVPRWLEQRVGGAQPNISQQIIRDTPIPLPQIEEQRRIADILDRADAIRRKRQEAIRMTEELLRSAFLEMFGDPVTNPKGWEVVKFDAVTESKLGKMFWEESLTGLNPVPYLGNTHVRWRSFDLSELPTMDFSESELQKLDLRDGDLVVCEGGEVGRCAIWRNQLKEISFQKALHRVRCDETKVVPEYLQEYFFLMAKHGGLSSSTSSATIAHLTGVKLKQLPLPLPPIEQQRLFQKVYATYEHSNQKYHNALAEQENLFNSLLQRAFRGEL